MVSTDNESDVTEKSKVAEAFAKAAGISENDSASLIETPPNPLMGDFAVPCFFLAKEMKKSPAIIADELRKKINSEKYLFLEKTEVSGPYLNFFVRKGNIADTALSKICSDGEMFGAGNAKKEKIMVEFSDPNTHKAFHIGHLRNAALGDSLVRILRFSGYDVIAANYLGDVGAHVGKCIWALEKYHKGEIEKIPIEKRGDFLGEVYSDATRRIDSALEKGDKSLKEEAAAVAKKMEEGDAKLTALWKETKNWSVSEFMRIYAELGIKFDVMFWESEFEKRGKDIVAELLRKKIAEKSEGAVIVNLKEYGLDVFLILRTDGTALYATKDLALAEDKFLKYKVDKSIYVVGSEQKMYFSQLFKTLELMGFSNAKKCHHLPHELVMLEEGKMSSRQGNVVTYSNLYSEVLEKAALEIEKRHPDWLQDEKADASRKITIAALKFGMLNQDNKKPIVFSIEKALDFEGDTAAYVQYAYTRASSVIRKNEEENSEKITLSDYRSEYSLLLKEASEIALLKKLSDFPSVVGKAGEDYKPFLLPKYLLESAKLFSAFYNECQIIKAEKELRHARIILSDSFRAVVKKGLYLCGIETLERM
jgi:arginyl-tRNA synthetase